MSQLYLEKNDLENVPPLTVPDGYVLRTYRDGDAAGIVAVYTASSLGDGTVAQFERSMLGHPCFEPERLFVVEYVGEIVGSIGAWVEAEQDPGVGYLHMLGTLPGHRGKGLGKTLSVAGINYSRVEGFTRERLSTDDWRVHALRIYLSLGFYPLIRDDTHPERWRAVGEQIGFAEAIARARDLRRVEGT